MSFYTIDEKKIAEDDLCNDLEALGFNAWLTDYYIPANPDFETVAETKEETKEEKENVSTVYNHFRNVYKNYSDFINKKNTSFFLQRNNLPCYLEKAMHLSFCQKKNTKCSFLEAASYLLLFDMGKTSFLIAFILETNISFLFQASAIAFLSPALSKERI